jgi:hypothetical protein
MHMPWNDLSIFRYIHSNKIKAPVCFMSDNENGVKSNSVRVSLQIHLHPFIGKI